VPTAWLSEEWCKEVAALSGSRPTAADVTGTVAVSITGGPGGDCLYHWTYRDGVPGAGAIGAAAGADLTLVIGRDDARAVAVGKMEPSVAFMRGRLKATGDGSLLLGLLASTATPAYRQWREQAMELADPG
jgi:hypothetical protein